MTTIPSYQVCGELSPVLDVSKNRRHVILLSSSWNQIQETPTNLRSDVLTLDFSGSQGLDRSAKFRTEVKEGEIKRKITIRDSVAINQSIKLVNFKKNYRPLCLNFRKIKKMHQKEVMSP